MIRETHTYVILEISQSAYDEIAAKLRAANYGHAFHDRDAEYGTVIDLHGIAVGTKGETFVPVTETEERSDE